ncbi:MAG: ATP-binding protein [Candidatus Thorarchaeota archaeon]|nr:MAG: ATP-binding protein [Candidatus Thorarchaeota archaeon]
MNSERLLNCRILLATWGHEDSEQNLKLILNTLRGTISQSDKKERLQIEIHSGKRARKILSNALEMRSKIRRTTMLPKDAIPYYMIPQREMGIIQGSTASFSTAGTERIQSIEGIPFKQDHIALGTIYRSGKLDKNKILYIKTEHLRRHVAILGMTGTGKSSTKNRIVIDAWMNGIPSLLIEPVKLDTRNLLAAIDEIRIFTIGRETVTPFRLNPFLIEEGVPVQAHIDQLYFAFLAAWPLGGILANHLRKVFVRTYRRNGWDILMDKPGRPVSVQDFRDEAERYANELQYGSELRQDFRGAILTRAEDLCDPARAAIFNATHNLPVSELLSKPTVIALGHLKDPEFKALMLNLILHRIEQYFGKLGPADELRSLILIDEAHRFLRELPLTLDMSEIAMSKRQVQDQLEDLTAEARSVGIGIIVLDQDPSQLSRRVLKNCHTKIVHRLESPDDVQLAALLTGCDKEQQAHICDMVEGEAIVKGLGHSVPLNIQIFHDPLFTDGMKSNWSDAEVIERMKQFYSGHPEFAKTPDIPQLDSPEVIIDRDLLALRVHVEDIVRSEGFRSNYQDCIESGDAEEINALEELIVFYATQVVSSDRPLVEIVDVLIETINTVYGEPPFALSYTTLQRLLRDYIQSRTSSPYGRDSREP